ncbi:hypothetical protein [Cellulomonas uda]|uniref:Uncharacterized protein n=1 Tax=Cellulomonas uda TaxID=1714 RepID=A0A4Y3KFR9_CELUD|nr:hypothetical protein [Cellulomonas uda]NII66944.1 hypothetical protein [Cellulomonas uda]GEA82733.1 hypothetical protein CUD01_31770 [Cellulomonas uda]
MSGADPRPSGARLRRRSWTAAGAVLPVTGVATIAGCVVAAGLASGPAQRIVVAAVLVVGVLGGVLWRRAGGAEATHGRVASARAAWARTWNGARLVDDGPPDPRDAALALPRGWRVEAARGRLRLAVSGMPVRCETWVLRAVPGSRRSPVRREVVAADARTGPARVSVPIGATADSMLVTPAWAGRRGTAEPAWLPAVRERVARHEDLLATLTIGDDRVVLLALDDPRPETTVARAQLVRDVAAMIG